MTSKVIVNKVSTWSSSDLSKQVYKPILVVTINRPERRNAVDPETADALYQAFLDFDGDEEVNHPALPRS